MFSNKLSVKAVAAILTIFSTSVNAHMIMTSPMPYGKSTLTNSPLDATGDDFPCKQRTGVYDLEGASNTMAVGEAQTLSFEGSAVHGGGSCQVSLSTDLAPTASSTWMVIHSIQGNCPSNVTGNLDDNAAGTGAAAFQYTIPTGIAPGQYTIAWSWVNKVGNREFYMNCGPATITAAKKKRYAPAPKTSKRQSTYPPMFVANLVSVNDCVTVEEADTVYPDPGASVQNGNIGVNLVKNTCAVYANAAGGNATSPAAASAPAAAPSAASSMAATSSAAGGVFASGAAGSTSTAVVSPIPAATSAASAPSGAAGASSPSSAASGSSPVASGTSSTAGAQSGACTDEGEWSCSADSSSFQRCASGTWSTAMPMAAGTSCTPGMSANLAMTATKSKRFSNHVRRAHRLSDALSLTDRV